MFSVRVTRYDFSDALFYVYYDTQIELLSIGIGLSVKWCFGSPEILKPLEHSSASGRRRNWKLIDEIHKGNRTPKRRIEVESTTNKFTGRQLVNLLIVLSEPFIDAAIKRTHFSFSKRWVPVICAITVCWLVKQHQEVLRGYKML